VADVCLPALVAALAAQPERAADPLHVDADHPRALAEPSERSRRQARQVAQLGVAAVGERRLHALAQRVDVEVERFGAGRSKRLFAHALLDRRALDSAEEEAIEHLVEHVTVAARLGERGGERLTENDAVAPADGVESGDRVEHLRRSDRKALAAQLVAELGDACRHPRATGRR